MIKKNKKRLDLIEKWLHRFPCNSYWCRPKCIHEYITPEEMMLIIDKMTAESPYKGGIKCTGK